MDFFGDADVALEGEAVAAVVADAERNAFALYIKGVRIRAARAALRLLPSSDTEFEQTGDLQ